VRGQSGLADLLIFGPCLFLAVMIRKGGITRSSLQREWPHHVVLSADKVRGLENSELVRGFPDGLSVGPLTYSLRREDLHFVVFCFADPKDADAFCDRCGWERLPGRGDEPGVKWSRVTVEQPP
jgi:hypothetical protein